MILYANGCSHTAAAEAVVPECFAVDDGRYGIDRRPHPVNLTASWCTLVARRLGMNLVCEAEAGGSNPRIVRTTQAWLEANQDLWPETLVIIQWTTWERQEWLHNGIWYQVNASGQDWVPKDLRHRYKKFIADVDWRQATDQCHQAAWDLHQWLLTRQICHVFFSGQNTFESVTHQLDWGKFYMHPYQNAGSYHNWLRQNGGTYVNSNSHHFDAKSHRLWAENVLQYINRNQILEPINEISAD